MRHWHKAPQGTALSAWWQCTPSWQGKHPRCFMSPSQSPLLLSATFYKSPLLLPQCWWKVLCQSCFKYFGSLLIGSPLSLPLKGPRVCHLELGLGTLPTNALSAICSRQALNSDWTKSILVTWFSDKVRQYKTCPSLLGMTSTAGEYYYLFISCHCTEFH